MTIFIGGPLDGQNRQVPPQHSTYRIADMPRLRAADWQESSCQVQVYRQIRYNKLKWSGVEFFAEESLSPTDVMHRLLESYHK